MILNQLIQKVHSPGVPSWTTQETMQAHAALKVLQHMLDVEADSVGPEVVYNRYLGGWHWTTGGQVFEDV